MRRLHGGSEHGNQRAQKSTEIHSNSPVKLTKELQLGRIKRWRTAASTLERLALQEFVNARRGAVVYGNSRTAVRQVRRKNRNRQRRGDGGNTISAETIPVNANLNLRRRTCLLSVVRYRRTTSIHPITTTASTLTRTQCDLCKVMPTVKRPRRNRVKRPQAALAAYSARRFNIGKLLVTSQRRRIRRTVSKRS